MGEGAPLPWRVRPRSLEEFFGQRHLLGEGMPLREMLKAGVVPSCVLWGPPGVGKTTLARLMAEATGRDFLELNATSSGLKELKALMEGALDLKAMRGSPPVVFVDEIYHFNKLQQDVLLPAVERGDFVLVGTTVDRPAFEVNKALMSRMLVFELKPLEVEDLKGILERAFQRDPLFSGLSPEEGFFEELARLAGGDARRALNALEACALAIKASGRKVLSREVAGRVLSGSQYRYDPRGDEHYDVISAFIKSVRGSDPDASLYWLVRMISAGEDPRFICRRLMILAAEDVGLADPMALVLASSAAYACENVGMPEAALVLAEATLYLALAPKSNSAYLALGRAQRYLEEGGLHPVPEHLRSGGKGYVYPHDRPFHWVEQRYWEGREVFYRPGKLGREQVLFERFRAILEAARRS